MAKPQVIWFDKEEKYLKYLYEVSLKLSKQYMELYKQTHAKQTRLRLPAIILSSFSGLASFGNTGFPRDYQRYVSIAVGLINVSIAMIQTYESYLKVADIVAKSLTVSSGLKKLAEDIHCEIFIPIEDRETNGITFLRDCFSRYGAIIYQAPPLEFETEIEEVNIITRIAEELRRSDKEIIANPGIINNISERVEHNNRRLETSIEIRNQ